MKVGETLEPILYIQSNSYLNVKVVEQQPFESFLLNYFACKLFVSKFQV